MSTGRGQIHESHFGPVSELIDISQFLESAWPENADERDLNGVASAQSSTDLTDSALLEWFGRAEDRKRAIVTECR